MKKFKRLTALALALVMVLGLTTGAGAAGAKYSSWFAPYYKEMQELGILPSSFTSDHPLCGQHTERAAPPFLRMSRLDRTCQFCSLFCSGCNEKSRLYGNASRWAAAPCIYTYPYIYTSFSIYTGRAE